MCPPSDSPIRQGGHTGPPLQSDLAQQESDFDCTGLFKANSNLRESKATYFPLEALVLLWAERLLADVRTPDAGGKYKLGKGSRYD